jgi:hypothetical protein
MSKQWDISTTERAYFWRVEFWNNDEPAEGYWKSAVKVHIYEKEMNAGTTSQ